MLYVVNNTFLPCHDLLVQAKTVTFAGKDSLVFQWFVEVGPASVQKIESVRRALHTVLPPEGGFLSLRLMNTSREVLSENLYWLPDSAGNHTGLQHMPEASIQTLASRAEEGRIDVRIENPAGGPVAFFQRVSLLDRATKKRILPVAYSDNYVSALPGAGVTVSIDCPPDLDIKNASVSVRGWNVRERYLEIQTSTAKLRE
jgi:mannosylglycoprotein endo-beta-mannosidase